MLSRKEEDRNSIRWGETLAPAQSQRWKGLHCSRCNEGWSAGGRYGDTVCAPLGPHSCIQQVDCGSDIVPETERQRKQTLVRPPGAQFSG